LIEFIGCSSWLQNENARLTCSEVCGRIELSPGGSFGS
jgi:hypothetical protein